MFPTIFQIGNFSLHTYGLLIAVGFLLGIGLALREARREGIPQEKVLDLSFYIIFAAILGSRLLFVLINYAYYWEHPWAFFKVWEGGLVFYGGFILAFLTGIFYLKKQALPFWKMGDLLAPSIALGQVFGRLGCFAAGCCFGKTTDLPWAVTFRDPQSLAPTGIPLHPTQLYEALTTFLIFLILMALKRRPFFPGFRLLTYLFLYGSVRWFLEFFRGDYRGNLAGGAWSDTQYISLLLVFFSIIMALYLRKRKAATG
jgi:phosphatidylglycerol---prolipoprotein diacylglyceryl transferase